MSIAMQRAQKAFDELPQDLKESDLLYVLTWATNFLMQKEGAGHQFQLIATKDCRFQCSFAKPEWGGDHVSQPMDTAEEAVMMAVCEYLNGA